MHSNTVATVPDEPGAELAGPLKSIKLLTYNVGLLRIRVLGQEVFANPPFSKERMPFLPAAILACGADVIALQECYEECHFQEIYKALEGTYPHVAWKRSRTKLLQCSNGLVMLSKFPIESFQLEVLRKVSTLEKWMASKCNLNVIVEVPTIGKVTFVNTHTTAGGAVDPENPDVDKDREDELNQALTFCKKATDQGEHAIIIGDLNCGPEASKSNYDLCLAAGYRDTYLDGRDPDANFQQTWDPRNYLNVIGPHAKCPAQRCDHVFLSPSLEALCDNEKTKAEIVLTEECAPVKTKKGQIMSTLSDHYGLCVTLQLKIQ